MSTETCQTTSGKSQQGLIKSKSLAREAKGSELMQRELKEYC